MGTACTPGLRVSANTVVRKERRLPTKGKVLVEIGDEVNPETVVARAERQGVMHIVKVADVLGVDPSEVSEFMMKGIGDDVRAGEVIAVREISIPFAWLFSWLGRFIMKLLKR